MLHINDECIYLSRMHCSAVTKDLNYSSWNKLYSQHVSLLNVTCSVCSIVVAGSRVTRRT